MDRDGGGENVGTIKINNLFQPECEPTGEVPPPTYTSSNEREDEEEEEQEGDEEDEEEECSEGYVNSPSGECEDWDECTGITCPGTRPFSFFGTDSESQGRAAHLMPERAAPANVPSASYTFQTIF